MARENWVTSPSGVPYNWRFNPQAYSEVFARNANAVQALLVTKWDDAGDLKADLMESAEYVAGQAWLKRCLPLRCPESDHLYLSELAAAEKFLKPGDATGYGVQTRDDETGWWSADRITYLAKFQNPPFPVKADDDVKSLANPELNRYCTVTPSTVGSNRTVATQTRFILDDDPGTGVSEAAVVPESYIRFTVKQFLWPKAAINWAAISDRMNKVNADVFTIGGVVCPPESLAYEGLGTSPEEYTGPDGRRYVDVTHVLLRHPENWNKTLWPVPPTGLVWKYFRLADQDGKPAFDPPVRRFQKASFPEIFNPA